jgi:cation diffusion facilitator CzcD-associated flavoprotein CzcO
MNVQRQIRAESPGLTERFDVLIAGAGISGVGAAYHLTQQCPGTSFVVLETQAGFGGTWRTHRYPGIRSDSDLHTLRLSLQAVDQCADRDRSRDP